VDHIEQERKCVAVLLKALRRMPLFIAGASMQVLNSVPNYRYGAVELV